MPFEYQTLAVFTIFFLFAWVPVSIGKWQTFGTGWIKSNREPIAGKVLPAWAARCERAYNNLKDYFPGFIVAILVLGSMNKFDAGTQIAASVYVLARLGHYIIYGLGLVSMRALFFSASIFANVYLLIRIVT